jgi:hypothetical protein
MADIPKVTDIESSSEEYDRGSINAYGNVQLWASSFKDLTQSDLLEFVKKWIDSFKVKKVYEETFKPKPTPRKESGRKYPKVPDSFKCIVGGGCDVVGTPECNSLCHFYQVKMEPAPESHDRILDIYVGKIKEAIEHNQDLKIPVNLIRSLSKIEGKREAFIGFLNFMNSPVYGWCTESDGWQIDRYDCVGRKEKITRNFAGVYLIERTPQYATGKKYNGTLERHYKIWRKIRELPNLKDIRDYLKIEEKDKGENLEKDPETDKMTIDNWRNPNWIH